MTISVIDPINLRYRDVIAAKKGTCEPVPNNLVTANKISRYPTPYLPIPLAQGRLVVTSELST
jgi:hypothetical protein